MLPRMYESDGHVGGGGADGAREVGEVLLELGEAAAQLPQQRARVRVAHARHVQRHLRLHHCNHAHTPHSHPSSTVAIVMLACTTLMYLY